MVGFSNPKPVKALGQHWLHDTDVLNSIAFCAQVKPGDKVIEIGPGLGTLTDVLIKAGAQVVAVEFDKQLYNLLQKKYKNIDITLVNEDVLRFNFEQITGPYKVVANIPYYLTSHLIRIITSLGNPPETAALLVQKEVARRIAAQPGGMSKLSVFAQNSFNTSLGPVVGAEYFTPPPKVDSQVIILAKRPIKLVPSSYEHSFNLVVRAGFSEKRKKLRSSISGGLKITKQAADELLAQAGINPNERAQNLSLSNWLSLAKTLANRL